MTSKKEPGRGHAGWRWTIRRWLIEHGMSATDADAWLDAWEAEHRAIHPHSDSPEYWEGAAAWIVEQRKTRKVPT